MTRKELWLCVGVSCFTSDVIFRSTLPFGQFSLRRPPTLQYLEIKWSKIKWFGNTNWNKVKSKVIKDFGQWNRNLYFQGFKRTKAWSLWATMQYQQLKTTTDNVLACELSKVSSAHAYTYSTMHTRSGPSSRCHSKHSEELVLAQHRQYGSTPRCLRDVTQLNSTVSFPRCPH